MDNKPTDRQLEAMVNIYLGDQAADGYRTRNPRRLEGGGEDLRPWGMPDRYRRARGMGGATRRMFDQMGQKGFLNIKTTAMGRVYYGRKLTASALQVLAVRYPSLPDIADRLAQQHEQEARVAREAEEAAVAEKARRKAAMANLAERRADAMEAVLQDYQVRHDLSRDQLAAMWKRISDEEVPLWLAHS